MGWIWIRAQATACTSSRPSRRAGEVTSRRPADEEMRYSCFAMVPGRGDSDRGGDVCPAGRGTRFCADAYAGVGADGAGVRGDSGKRVNADPADCNPRSLAAAGSVCDGDSDSPAAWVVRGGESGDLRGGGLCDCGRKELIYGNAIGTSCAASQPYGKL